ncbi:MAG: DUF4294 domain-containing protein [Bacteroidales bacterium]|nr:DUF4294 domain-containing protein [Bacteroidales bacterium]
MKAHNIIIVFFILVLSASWQSASAQVPHYLRRIMNFDSIARAVDMPVLVSKEVYIFPKQSRHDSEFLKLKRNFVRVYPYALLIKEEMDAIEKHLQTLPDAKSQKKYINMKDKELKKKYKKTLMKMTLSQGVLLVKLVDRETGNTSFELIKELKGSITAFFWQSIALLFKNNLKAEYDPDGKDKDVEMLVRHYEAGTL